MALEENSSLPAHIEEEAYKLGPEVCLPLPRTLEESLDALNQNQILVDSLGKEFVKCFTAIKKHEIQLYKANERQYKLGKNSIIFSTCKCNNNKLL